jgi:hypothetical protein
MEEGYLSQALARKVKLYMAQARCLRKQPRKNYIRHSNAEVAYEKGSRAFYPKNTKKPGEDTRAKAE